MPYKKILIMKTILILLLAALALTTNAQTHTITNINIGTDLNSAAWAKVNANNDNFVAWLNADDVTNGYFFQQVTNLWANVTNMPSVTPHGQTYPSSTWDLFAATNGMKPGDFRLVNSNGMAQVDIWMSNSVPWIKQIAP
jgi:hypothetical protein